MKITTFSWKKKSDVEIQELAHIGMVLNNSILPLCKHTESIAIVERWKTLSTGKLDKRFPIMYMFCTRCFLILVIVLFPFTIGECRKMWVSEKGDVIFYWDGHLKYSIYASYLKLCTNIIITESMYLIKIIMWGRII